MAQSGITLSIRFQNDAGNFVYQGNGTSNLRLWGAVFELGSEVVDRAKDEFAGTYRYIRSLGSAGDLATFRYNYDTRSDAVTVGGTEPRKIARDGSYPYEHIAFDYIKQAKQAGTADPLGSDGITTTENITVTLNP